MAEILDRLGTKGKPSPVREVLLAALALPEDFGSGDGACPGDPKVPPAAAVGAVAVGHPNRREDFREGTRAFMEKGEPYFRGE